MKHLAALAAVLLCGCQGPTYYERHHPGVHYSVQDGVRDYLQAQAESAAAHEAQRETTVVIPAAGPGLQVPSWQPTNAPDPWHHEQYQAPKTYYTRPTWGGWVTTEQP